MHDGTWAYFLFGWDDPTRSLKYLPLVKEVDGGHLLHNGYENGDEHDYHEDKFSVLFATADAMLARDGTFRASPHPIPNGPTTMTGRGMHFTPKATSMFGNGRQQAAVRPADDAHFGPPLDPTPMQVSNAIRYRDLLGWLDSPRKNPPKLQSAQKPARAGSHG